MRNRGGLIVQNNTVRLPRSFVSLYRQAVYYLVVFCKVIGAHKAFILVYLVLSHCSRTLFLLSTLSTVLVRSGKSVRAVFCPSLTDLPGGDTRGNRQAGDRMTVQRYDDVGSCFNTKTKGHSTGPAFEFLSCHSVFSSCR